MEMVTKVLSVVALGFWFASPVSAQIDLGSGGNAGVGGVGGAVGNAVQGVGSGIQGATQGVGNAARGVQQGARNIQRNVRQLGNDAVQQTRQGIRNQSQNLRDNLSGQGRLGINSSTFVEANTPQIPAQVQADAQFNAQADRDARWRKIRHNGEWWYYSPEGNWMYMRDGQWNRYDEQDFQRPNADGTFSANFRGGSNSGDMWTQDGRSIYRLQSDAQGRQFIRLNGRQIWVGSDANISAGGGLSNQGTDVGLDANTEAGVGVE